MPPLHVELSHIIPAPADAIYAVLSDYEVGHPAILPKPYFQSLTVENGGQGEGTVINVSMKVMGVEAHYHMFVTEPQKGRILAEEDPEAGTITHFILEPLGETETKVTISTDMKGKPGLAGWIEKLVNPPIMRKIYREELHLLADYLKNKQH